ncbi:MAG: cupin domain-containing protein [Sphingomicrobium sp.]
MMKLLCLVSVLLLMAGSAVHAKPTHHALKWSDGPPSLPSGVKMAVVSGDPGKKGNFTIQLKMPANYAVPPHSHPTDEVLKIVSGKVHYGMSGTMDMAGAKTLVAGQSVKQRAKMNHWVHAPAPATVQVSGTGPFQINYVDPKDDPQTK